jgi:hypothetical protein
VFGLGALFLYGSGAQRVARWCLGGVLLAGAADTLENLPLLRGLDSLGGAGGDTAFRLTASLGVLKFAVGGPLLPVFVVVASVLAARRAYRPSRVVRREDASLPEIARASELDPGTTRRPDIILPPAVADSSTATLSATGGQSGPDVQQELAERRPRPAGRPPAEVGICASGGGIRSASVTLGALQALQRDVLSKARYLVSVSGGGYMTGAFQLALTRANPEAESLATPADVFTPGRPRRTTCAPRQVPGRRRPRVGVRARGGAARGGGVAGPADPWGGRRYGPQRLSTGRRRWST